MRNQKTPTLNEFLLVFENSQGVEQSLERFSNTEKRKMGTVNSKRKFVSFNGLPIKPSFITVDLSNKIMNHVTPNDFIELPFRVDLNLKGRLLPSVTLKNFYCIVLLILHSPLGLFLRNWNTWLLTEITNSNTLFSETRASEMREVGTGNFPF